MCNFPFMRLDFGSGNEGWGGVEGEEIPLAQASAFSSQHQTSRKTLLIRFRGWFFFVAFGGAKGRGAKKHLEVREGEEPRSTLLYKRNMKRREGATKKDIKR